MNSTNPIRSINSVPKISYEQVRARCGARLHRARSSMHADVYEVEWEGRRAVLKDFTARPWPVRWIMGRVVVGHEARVMSRLEGVRGVPQLIGMAGPEAILMERLDAQRLPKLWQSHPDPRYWADARRLLNELHATGVAHGDLRRLNLLIGADGGAYLIDFATAICRRENGVFAFAHNFAFERCRRIDHVTLARMKSRYAGKLADDEDRAWLATVPWYLLAGRWIRKHILAWRKPRHWRKFWRKWRRSAC